VNFKRTLLVIRCMLSKHHSTKHVEAEVTWNLVQFCVTGPTELKFPFREDGADPVSEMLFSILS
jgi:hypothetical protein